MDKLNSKEEKVFRYKYGCNKSTFNFANVLLRQTKTLSKYIKRETINNCYFISNNSKSNMHFTKMML